MYAVLRPSVQELHQGRMQQMSIAALSAMGSPAWVSPVGCCLCAASN